MYSKTHTFGQMAELVDAPALGAGGSNPVGVRVSLCPRDIKTVPVCTVFCIEWVVRSSNC